MSELPDWLTPTSSLELPDPPEPCLPPETKARILAQYEIIFPRVLDAIYGGSTLANALREIPIEIDQGAFYRWLKKDPQRLEQYKEAKEIRTEAWAGKIIEHATGEVAGTVMEDVARSKLVVDTYKWLMQADNRRTYGDTKQIEVNQNISITAALAAAQGRVQEVIEAEWGEAPRLLESGDDEDDD